MKNQIEITASIVLHKENMSEVINTIQCFLSTPLSKKLYLVDNTKNNFFQGKLETKDVKYLNNKKNIGFGRGHNRVITEIRDYSKYHLILNPDVTFQSNLIPVLIKQYSYFKDLTMIAPKVIFPNGLHQYSCRRYPTLKELISRRFSFIKKYFKETVEKGEYRDKDLSEIFNPDYITGCFQIYKTKDFVELGGFDERYFLYMEDIDICRKIDHLGKQKLYYPNVEITHVLKQGSAKNPKLFLIHTMSAFKYFLKWGFK
jgi:GT2 family glycosyltransferase